MRPHNLNPAILVLTSALMVAAMPTVSHASFRVDFSEGAPKDRFRIENNSSCAIESSAITLDISTASAGLIFDVTAQGAVVEVFQPFQIVEGAEFWASTPSVVDGQSQAHLTIDRLAPGQAVAFTIDVDDTRGHRAITVSGSEIEGANVAFRQSNVSASAAFSNSARADLVLPTFPSSS